MRRGLQSHCRGIQFLAGTGLPSKITAAWRAGDGEEISRLLNLHRSKCMCVGKLLSLDPWPPEKTRGERTRPARTVTTNSGSKSLDCLGLEGEPWKPPSPFLQSNKENSHPPSGV